MAKAYWIAFYRSIKNAEALAEYVKLAGPAIGAGGGNSSRAVFPWRPTKRACASAPS
jgi:hypothetical protein